MCCFRESCSEHVYLYVLRDEVVVSRWWHIYELPWSVNVLHTELVCTEQQKIIIINMHFIYNNGGLNIGPGFRPRALNKRFNIQRRLAWSLCKDDTHNRREAPLFWHFYKSSLLHHHIHFLTVCIPWSSLHVCVYNYGVLSQLYYILLWWCVVFFIQHCMYPLQHIFLLYSLVTILSIHIHILFESYFIVSVVFQ